MRCNKCESELIKIEETGNIFCPVCNEIINRRFKKMNKRQTKKNYKKLYVELENKYYELFADHTRVCLELEELKAKTNKPKTTRKKKTETGVTDGNKN